MNAKCRIDSVDRLLPRKETRCRRIDLYRSDRLLFESEKDEVSTRRMINVRGDDEGELTILVPRHQKRFGF
jgi:hypothetical protein